MLGGPGFRKEARIFLRARQGFTFSCQRSGRFSQEKVERWEPL
jgi:hypothetical protein